MVAAEMLDVAEALILAPQVFVAEVADVDARTAQEFRPSSWLGYETPKVRVKLKVKLPSRCSHRGAYAFVRREDDVDFVGNVACAAD